MNLPLPAGASRPCSLLEADVGTRGDQVKIISQPHPDGVNHIDRGLVQVEHVKAQNTAVSIEAFAPDASTVAASADVTDLPDSYQVVPSGANTNQLCPVITPANRRSVKVRPRKWCLFPCISVYNHSTLDDD